VAFDQSEWIWMDGQVIRWNDANVHISAHALHYGSGVFEGIRCYETVDGPAVFRMDEHLDRLFASAAIYSMDIPYTREELDAAICDIILRNGYRSCYVRPLCFFGSDSLGVHPRNCPLHVAILTWPWGAYLGAEEQETGVRVTVSSWQKFGLRMLPATAKGCGQYLNSMLAVREAISKGFDEALLLNVDGTIAEGSGENLFLVRDGRLLTNDQQSSILMGITRNAVIEIARDLGFEVDVRELWLEDLLASDEAFFTGTATEVAPIREVDGRPIGNGARGPITEKIQRVFFAATSGSEARYRGWLRSVSQQTAKAF
jgi:branched-chain amino acid aminotransferase